MFTLNWMASVPPKKATWYQFGLKIREGSPGPPGPSPGSSTEVYNGARRDEKSFFRRPTPLI